MVTIPAADRGFDLPPATVVRANRRASCAAPRKLQEPCRPVPARPPPWIVPRAIPRLLRLRRACSSSVRGSTGTPIRVVYPTISSSTGCGATPSADRASRLPLPPLRTSRRQRSARFPRRPARAQDGRGPAWSGKRRGKFLTDSYSAIVIRTFSGHSPHSQWNSKQPSSGGHPRSSACLATL